MLTVTANDMIALFGYGEEEEEGRSNVHQL
jgi:hypothetical protein